MLGVSWVGAVLVLVLLVAAVVLLRRAIARRRSEHRHTRDQDLDWGSRLIEDRGRRPDPEDS